MSQEKARVLLNERGFTNKEEFLELINAVDTSTFKKYIAFKVWKVSDGTKEGLLKLERKSCQTDTQSMPQQRQLGSE